MELRLLPNSRSPPRKPDARLMGRTNSQHRPTIIIIIIILLLLLRHLSPRHLHDPNSHRALTALHHRPRRRDNLQRRRNHGVRRLGPAGRVDHPARWLGYGERAPALRGGLSKRVSEVVRYGVVAGGDDVSV